MNALLLPGNSQRHSKWMGDLKLAISPLLETIVSSHYKHWKTGEECADVDYEILLAKESTKELGEYIIIAKSIGAVIAAKGTNNGAISPKKLILLGVPVNGVVSAKLFAEYLTKITIPIVIIQNTNDPLGSF